MATKTYITTENLGRFKTKLMPEVEAKIDDKIAEIPAYELPVATGTTLGGIKVGAGLSITDGTVSVAAGGVADSVEWSGVQNKPTTLEGYGITDGITPTDVDTKITTAIGKIPAPDLTNYSTTSEMNVAIAAATTDMATTDDITAATTDLATKTEVTEAVTGLAATTYVDNAISGLASTAYVDGKVSGIYHFKGTVANLAALQAITDATAGDVYNLADTGMNAAWVAPAGEAAGYWDDFGTTVDLSGYVLASDLVAATDADIDGLFA